MTQSTTSVSIIGCGWLGTPLARQMVLNGCEVKGTTTTASKISPLKEQGIDPYFFDYTSGDEMHEELFKVDFLVINLPPGRRDQQKLIAYAPAIAAIMQKAASFRRVKKVVFVSSSSVYGNDLDEFSEKTPAIPDTDSGKVIREAEMMVMKSEVPYIILRFGGLAGPNRHPGKFLAGRKDLTSGEQRINFLHLEDAQRVIRYLLELDMQNEIFNVASPMHPKKKIFYAKMAEAIGAAPPTFVDGGTHFKREMSVDKLLKTNFEFLYPDPLHYKFDD